MRVDSIEQKLEAYCDDVNITTDKLEDFEVVDNVVKRFKKVSGAILSRNKKCKVIGFGGIIDCIRFGQHLCLNAVLLKITILRL